MKKIPITLRTTEGRAIPHDASIRVSQQAHPGPREMTSQKNNSEMVLDEVMAMINTT
jgi:hypothetical protein